MLDYAIKGLTVSDVATMNAALQPTMVRQVIFFIGARGPFMLNFTPAEYTPEAVIIAVQNEVSTLQRIDSGLEQA